MSEQLTSRYTLRCPGCPYGFADTLSAKSTDDAMRQFEANGWQHTGETYVCPLCVSAREEGAQ